jgi:adenylate kinase family enzyme
MDKVIIVGNSGSGKTWLGMRAAAVLGIPHVQLDAVFWEPGGFNRKRRISDVEACLGKIQASPSWLAEGVFGHLADALVPFADTLVYVDLSWEECRKNLESRGSESSAQLDPESAERNFRSLLEWASCYETRDSKASMKYHHLLFERFPGDRYKLQNRREVVGWLEMIRESKA